ncbi:MAG: DUF983 domain-containing protein [Flavobacterium sp.]|nr:MAG: DUF983 domain-containing protein [Flavobacterium sp.]
MLKKGTKLYSILTGTCPKCQLESMYVNKNPFIITETMKMHDHCGHCGTKYKMEPNFFFGAMYVSYAVAVLIGILIFLTAYFGFKANVKTSFLSIFVGLIVLMPWITRISRNIYINMFMDYDPNAVKRKNA